jgi:pteridine reductase
MEAASWETARSQSLKGRVVVVTGGAARLGRAIALECARRGASVAITYNTSGEAARRTLEELRGTGDEAQRFEAYGLDVSKSEAVQKLVRDVETDLGGASDLVNNAAIFRRTPFAEMGESDFDAHIDANLRGPFLTCKYFGQSMRERGGSIVNMADIYGLRPLKNYAPYCVSKAGVVMLTQVLALALAPQVRVNAVCPGTILLPSQEQGEGDTLESLVPKVPLGRLGSESDIAQAVAFLLESPYLSGVLLPVDGAQHLK